MSHADAIPVIEEAYALQATSFLRYLVEVSRPPVVDQVDQQAIALYQDIYRDVTRNAQALADLLSDEGVVVREVNWPLSYTSYNFLRPRYLLRPACERLRRQHDAMLAKSEALLGCDWPVANEVMGGVLRRERSALERLEKAVEETPAEQVAPARLRGTSASRW